MTPVNFGSHQVRERVDDFGQVHGLQRGPGKYARRVPQHCSKRDRFQAALLNPALQSGGSQVPSRRAPVSRAKRRRSFCAWAIDLGRSPRETAHR